MPMGKRLWIVCVLCLIGLCASAQPAGPTFERFFAWNMPVVASDARQAATMGVTDAVVSAGNAKQLQLARQVGIRAYLALVPSTSLWTRKRPGQPAPEQRMSPEEEALYTFRWVNKSEGLNNPSHYGGEPIYDPSTGHYLSDVLGTRLLCLSHPETRRLLLEILDEYIATPGCDGIAFDFFGYMNLHGCYCAHCLELYQAYLATAALADTPATRNAFYRSQLVEINNLLVRHIRQRTPQLLSMTHIYPVFLPDPLYGKDLEFDFCCETAAWYFHWPVEKIAEYSEHISAYLRGVHFIGYYNPRLTFPEKTPERVDLELRTMLHHGARYLSVCGFSDVLKHPGITAVFQKYLNRRELPEQP